MLANHDHRKQVAVVRDQDGKRFVEFLGDTRITKEAFFEIFGGDCFNVLELTEEAGGSTWSTCRRTVRTNGELDDDV